MSSRRIVKPLAGPSRRCGLVEGFAEASGPRFVGVSGNVGLARGREALPERWVVVEPADRRREYAGIARGHYEAVALVAHEPARGGADGVSGDDCDVLVHGFVCDQAPRLAEPAGRDRRYDENVGPRIEVADLF